MGRTYKKTGRNNGNFKRYILKFYALDRGFAAATRYYNDYEEIKRDYMAYKLFFNLVAYEHHNNKTRNLYFKYLL